jgi:hypothetical protein
MIVKADGTFDRMIIHNYPMHHPLLEIIAHFKVITAVVQLLTSSLVSPDVLPVSQTIFVSVNFPWILFTKAQIKLSVS